MSPPKPFPPLPPLELDVRPLLDSGRQPLPTIMAAVEQLAPGQALRLLAPFEPRPLYARMAARGYTVAPEIRDDHWVILFHPNEEGS